MSFDENNTRFNNAQLLVLNNALDILLNGSNDEQRKKLYADRLQNSWWFTDDSKNTVDELVKRCQYK